MYMVDDGQVKQVFVGLPKSMGGMALAMYLAVIAQALLPSGGEAAAQLRLLLNSLYLISEQKKPLAQIKAVYELRSVCEAGYMPALLCCKSCQKYDGGNFYFDVGAGDLLCGDCAEAQGIVPNLDEGALVALRHIALVEDKKVFSFTLSQKSLEKLSRVTERYAAARLDKPLKTLDFLHSVLE